MVYSLNARRLKRLSMRGLIHTRRLRLVHRQGWPVGHLLGDRRQLFAYVQTRPDIFVE
jgi:hypothetical protein